MISGVGPARREELSKAGLASIDAVAHAPESAIARIKGIGPATALNVRTAAESLLTVEPVVRTKLKSLPQATTEVFLDLEGTDPRIDAEGLEVVNYLIGVVVCSQATPASYVPFFAPTFAEEARNLRGFLE